MYEGICGGMKVFEVTWRYIKGYLGVSRNVKGHEGV